MSVPGTVAAAGALTHGGTLGWGAVVIVVLIVIAAAPLVRHHRRATAVTGRPSRVRSPAKIKHSDYYWQSRNLAHLAPEERISRGLPSVHREQDWK